MKTKSKIGGYSIAAAVLLLTAQISLAGSATWLLSPQDSAWENANNWTTGGPPNGPSDIATFAQSSQTDVNISTPEEVNSIVFTSDSASFNFIFWGLTISGTGVTNNSGVLQSFQNWGGLVFKNTSTAASAYMSIDNSSFDTTGYTIFNDSSSAAGASISNSGSPGGFVAPGGPAATFFNGTSTAGHAGITNHGGFPVTEHDWSPVGGYTEFHDSSTADSATFIANGISYGVGGAIVFYDASTGGTARVQVFYNGYLHIADHQSGLSIGSIEGSGNVFLGANDLTVGTNGINTSFSGVISGSGSLAKVGSGVLTLQANDCIADTVGLILVSGSVIKLDFTGAPDVIASLNANGVSQPPGIYGSPTSGAPHRLPQFAGPGT